MLLTCFIGSYTATITLDLIDRYEKKRNQKKENKSEGKECYT